MPTIEQVTKRLFSDKNWLKKCLIGGLLALLPILSFGYLYKIFESGKRGAAFELPEWNEFQKLALDGVKFLLILIVFVVLPVALCEWILEVLGRASSIFRILWIPLTLLEGPVFCVALYFFSVRGKFKDCFNFSAYEVLLRKGAFEYAVPTLAFCGLLAVVLLTQLWVLMPFVFFFGGTVYFYIMARIIRSLEIR